MRFEAFSADSWSIVADDGYDLVTITRVDNAPEGAPERPTREEIKEIERALHEAFNRRKRS